MDLLPSSDFSMEKTPECGFERVSPDLGPGKA